MPKQKNLQVPNYATLIEATYRALKELGGSGRNDEINKKVYQILELPDSVLEILHTGRTTFSEVDYRLAWARTLLKNYGAIVNSARRVWVISPEYTSVEKVSGEEVENAETFRKYLLNRATIEKSILRMPRRTMILLKQKHGDSAYMKF